jgi:pre-mRNA cleavage complex 2 protein Pcf11
MPVPQNMMPQHFVNPWESNPMVMAMQAQSQMPLVVPQSTSHPILNNKMRTLRLDGTKDHLLRFYNETAVIFNDVGEPHDIKFSAGQSRVVIDDQYSIDLNFNDVYKPFFIDGTMHQIKFGSPTRELYIDHHFYECYFNNQPTQIVLNNNLRRVRIEGNAPEVKIGRKRNDLVLGLINIVIDAEAVVPVFLDTSVQYFEFKGKILTLQFADFFLSVVINNDPFKVEFGGLPKNFTLNGQKHFIRFTGLPDSVHPGRVNMVGMRRTNLFRNCRSPPIIEPLDQENLDINQLVENNMRDEPGPMMPLNNSLPPNVIPGIGSEAQGAPAIGVPNLDINDLLKQLLEKGIIGGGAEAAKAPAVKEVKAKSPDRAEEARRAAPRVDERRTPIVPISLSRPDTIKKRQQAIVDTLYSGIQCSSCGLRFPPEQTMKYSQHLDWHFRQNRRERDSKRRAHFRKWYYNQSDWIKYEEIEDLEDRGELGGGESRRTFH